MSSLEKRIILFNQWVEKSEAKFGEKYSKSLRTGSVTLNELRYFVDRSTRMLEIVRQLEIEKKSSISFAELYLNSKEDILINCPEIGHGLVCITPQMHQISPTGCTKCSGKYQRTEAEFDKDLLSIFGETIKRESPYINQKKPMTMKCEVKNHPSFKKTGSDLLNGKQGCPRCQIEQSSEKRRWKKDEWIIKSQQVYPLEKDDYSNIVLEIVENILWVHDIYCKIHKLFYCQRANDHHNRHRSCSLCKRDNLSNYFRLPYEELIQRCLEIHSEEKYEYEEKEPEDYKNGNSKIPVRCNQTFPNGKTHGVWYPTAHNHLNGSKCPGCKSIGYSKIALHWLSTLSNLLGFDIEHAENGGEYKIPNSKYSCDGFVKDIKCIFEFHGCHVHGCKDCYKNREDVDCYGRYTHEKNYQKTLEKKKFCEDKGYKYIEIWHCEWEKICYNTIALKDYIEELKLKYIFLLH